MTRYPDLNDLSFLYLEPWTALFSAAMLRRL